MLVVAGVLGGCTELHPTPDNGRESCDGVGASYTADGRCVGGSASLTPASPAKSPRVSNRAAWTM
jgi:hypothetical protein